MGSSALDGAPAPWQASNHCEKSEAGAQFLPISAAVGHHIDAHGTPGHGQKETHRFGEETWNPDEPTPNSAVSVRSLIRASAGSESRRWRPRCRIAAKRRTRPTRPSNRRSSSRPRTRRPDDRLTRIEWGTGARPVAVHLNP